MGETYTSSKRLYNRIYCGFFCCILMVLIFANYSDAYAYKAISPSMTEFISEAEEKLVVNTDMASDFVTKKMEETNQSKFYEVILNEDCNIDKVDYTQSYINYANAVANKVLQNKSIHDSNTMDAVIIDKTKALSVVGINNFNIKLKYGMNIKEMDLFYKIVQAEAGCEDLKGKILVANVILNRVRSTKFPNTIRGVIMAPGQFQPVRNGKIYTVKVSSETKLAVNMALKGEDYSNGALYFMARSASSSSNVTWFDRALTRVVKHGNHEFFR